MNRKNLINNNCDQDESRKYQLLNGNLNKDSSENDKSEEVQFQKEEI